MAVGRIRSMLVVAGVLLALASMGGTAFAAGSSPNGPPIVRGKQINKPHAGPVVHAATIHQAPVVAGDTLPFTGGDVVLFLGIGMVTFAAGLTMYRRAKLSTATS